MNAVASGSTPPTPGPLVACLAFLLVVWEPVSFALTASSSLGRLAGFGLPAFALLAARVAVTGFGIVVGRALWAGTPHAPRAARLWLVLASLVLVATFATPYFPSNRLPGTKGPLLALLLLHHLAWYLYLLRSRRVRAAFAEVDADGRVATGRAVA